MSVQLMFPNFVFSRSFLGHDKDKDPSMTPEYFQVLKNDIDAMRSRDPVGRSVSNDGGWQSKDGVESSPAFVKCFRGIRRLISEEMMPFLGLKRHAYSIDMHNSWANINHRGNWNRPHLHNGCFYSGVLYIQAEGNEGNIQFLDKDNKIAGSYPACPRIHESHLFTPRTGDLHLFPSGLMHLVEPNQSLNDRYSISFNLNIETTHDINNRQDDVFIEGDCNYPLVFQIGPDGKLIV